MKLSGNHQWKGDKAKYMALHNFARRHFGNVQFCEMCKTTKNRMYHWAVRNQTKGSHNKEDWIRLCVPCHAKHDGRTGRIVSLETKRKIGEKNKINSLGNTNAKGHKLSIEKRKEISEKTKLGMNKVQ